jgi:hypothetical protein
VIKPQIIIIAGPNGSGKSTLTDHGGLAQYGLVFSQLRIEPINEPITLAYDPPNYINEALIQPLETRKLQRLTLSQEFPSATPPDERIGTYTGPIRFACSHYIIQEDSHHGLIRHDLLLFPENSNLANITTITYDLNNNPHIHLTP